MRLAGMTVAVSCYMNYFYRLSYLLSRAVLLIAAFSATCAQANDSTVRPATCGLLVRPADLNSPYVSAFKKMGYLFYPESDLLQLDKVQTAKRLNDHQYIFRVDNGIPEIRLSITDGESSPTWRPLVLKLPTQLEVGFSANKSYFCSTLAGRMDFFRQSRKATEEAINWTHGIRGALNLGEIFLDLENTYFVYNGDESYNQPRAKQAYRDILSQANELVKNSERDFYNNWFEIRKLLYRKSRFGIDYCLKGASMSSALVNKCTNCVGETYLMIALIFDLNLQMPAEWTFSIQEFSDHLRPVLYNASRHQTYDLTTGRLEPVRSALVSPLTIINQLLKRSSQLKFSDEVATIKNYPIDYTYRSLSCLINPTYTGNQITQPSEMSDLASCDRFSDRTPPEHASNDVKTLDVQLQVPDQESSIFSGAEKLWSNLQTKDSLESTQIDFENLQRIALTLNTQEQAILNRVLRERHLTSEAAAYFSKANILSHPTDTTSSGDKSPLYIPIVFIDSQDSSQLNTFALFKQDLYSSGSSWMQFGFSGFCLTSTILIKDKEFYEKLKPLNTSERIKLFFARFNNELSLTLSQVDSFIPSATDRVFMATLFSPATKAALEKLSHELGILEDIQTSLKINRSDLGVYKPIDEDLSLEFLRSLDIAKLSDTVDKIREASKTLDAHAIEFVRWLDQQTFVQNSQVQVSDQILALDMLDFRTSNEPLKSLLHTSRSQFQTPKFRHIYESLLYQTLSNRRYFFTVTPDSEEVQLLSKNRKVLAAAQIESAEHKTARLPKVTLPHFPVSPSLCDGKSGLYMLSGSIAIECATDDSDSGIQANNSSQQFKDPRVEVDLKPETWSVLLTGWGAAPDPATKFLFHHAYRKQLERIAQQHAELKVFVPSDYSSRMRFISLDLPVRIYKRVVPLGDFGYFQHNNRMDMRAELRNYLNSLPEDKLFVTPDFFAPELEDEPFYAMAVAESRYPKPGFASFTAEGIASSGSTDNDSAGGATQPVVAEDSSGRQSLNAHIKPAYGSFTWVTPVYSDESKRQLQAALFGYRSRASGAYYNVVAITPVGLWSNMKIDRAEAIELLMKSDFTKIRQD